MNDLQIDGFKTEETIRLPDGPQDDWLQVLPVTDDEEGPAISLQPASRPPLLFWPYYRAGGRLDGETGVGATNQIDDGVCAGRAGLGHRQGGASAQQLMRAVQKADDGRGVSMVGAADGVDLLAGLLQGIAAPIVLAHPVGIVAVGTLLHRQQLFQLLPNGALECVGCGAHELLAAELAAQAHHPGGLRQRGSAVPRHLVDLAADGVARDGALGPALGQQHTQPGSVQRKQARAFIDRVEGETVQGEMRRLGHRSAGQHGLELLPGPQPLDHRRASTDRAQTARRLRPLARRALMTARPPRVFMRTRKPWVRARRILEGW